MNYINRADIVSELVRTVQDACNSDSNPEIDLWLGSRRLRIN